MQLKISLQAARLVAVILATSAVEPANPISRLRGRVFSEKIQWVRALAMISGKTDLV
jgi:hypothetical protein